VDRPAGLILAAGSASRFGGAKLLAPLEGRPILQHVVDTLRPAVEPLIVVVGDMGEAIAAAMDLGAVTVVHNPDPARGLSGSVALGIAAVPSEVASVLIALGDQPLVAPAVVAALIAAGVDEAHPFAVPVYTGDAGRNPVLVHRSAFGSVAELQGDRGLGPVLADQPDRVREVPVTAVTANPDVDTRADLVALLETRWAARVRENAAQVDRHREVPDGQDFYAPVTGLFRADPTRTDEPALTALLALVGPGETWLDIGAGAGRYALPIARHLAASGGRVIAVDASAGMLDALRGIAAQHAIEHVEVIHDRWPPADGDLARFAADVALIAHVGYDIEAIGPFLAAMESAARRRCVAVLMERQPASVADPCWPPVHGEARVSLPALPEFVELLQAMGRTPIVERLDRAPRRFESREELEGFLRRQLWTEPGSAADRRFQAALDGLVMVDADGSVGLVDQRPMPIGIVTWSPPTGD
jgi:CTP:molybdopterin cytidylyltransferase MocA